MDRAALRQAIIDWLDDNYHFGDALALIGGDDDRSFLDNGILDSMGFVQLVLFLEDTIHITIDRGMLTRDNFDGMNKILALIVQLPKQANA